MIANKLRILQTYVSYLQIRINVYNIVKKTNCFLGEMPDLFKVKVNGTAIFTIGDIKLP